MKSCTPVSYTHLDVYKRQDYNLRTYDEWLDWKDSLVVEKPLKTKLSDEKFEEALHTVALLDQEAKLRGWKSVVDAMNNL